MQYGAPAYRPKTPSQGTAETLILVGFIFQLIVSVLFIALGVFGLLLGSFFLFFGFVGAGLLALAGILIFVPILMLYVAYHYCYQRVRDGDLAGARGPTLAMGIIGIFLGGLIVGILYIIAYVEIGSAENELRAMGVGPGGTGPYSNPYGSPYGYRRPTYGPGGVVYAPPATPIQPSAATCARCGRAATYIPQYGRSYCYACAQYV
ncbi:MAG: hypothetical protein L3K00_03030 [Thermoplasmata archaeon]|nr:hypothetical protein [Thermoplasmata archaeon]